MSDSSAAPAPSTDHDAFTEDDVKAILALMRENRFAGLFLLSLYDIDRANLRAMSELNVVSDSYKAAMFDNVRKLEAAKQEEIGYGLFQWVLTPPRQSRSGEASCRRLGLRELRHLTSPSE